MFGVLNFVFIFVFIFGSVRLFRCIWCVFSCYYWFSIRSTHKRRGRGEERGGGGKEGRGMKRERMSGEQAF